MYSLEYVRAWKQANSPQTAQLLERLMERMKSQFGEEHRMIDHTMKVYAYACEIRRVEEADPMTVKAAALLHDIGVPKARRVHGSSAGKYREIEGPPIACGILAELGVEAGKIGPVCQIIGNHHSAANADTAGMLEFKVVWDADWMVNFPHAHCEKTRDQLRQAIAETFKTSHGQYLARRAFLE